ncbi:hypothetical protein NL676_010761 [Syzygium grande]|nr:hypothetical protein NL676_010761 [Syzygium grande]
MQAFSNEHVNLKFHYERPDAAAADTLRCKERKTVGRERRYDAGLPSVYLYPSKSACVSESSSTAFVPKSECMQLQCIPTDPVSAGGWD